MRGSLGECLQAVVILSTRWLQCLQLSSLIIRGGDLGRNSMRIFSGEFVAFSGVSVAFSGEFVALLSGSEGGVTHVNSL